jgi:hypothetical protein
MNLTNQIQAKEHLNKQLNERLEQKEPPAHEQQPQIVSNADQESTTQVRHKLNLLNLCFLYLAIK